MLIFPPVMFRKPRARPRRKQRKAPAALVLVAAAYEPSTWVRLTFDRAVDLAALDPGQITVSEGWVSHTLWAGAGATLVGPAEVQVALVAAGPSTTTDPFLTATAATGIVAVNDGGAWAGVSDVVLPFSS